MAVDLLTPEIVAERLGIRRNTLIIWSKRGKIPRVVLSPRIIRFIWDDVVQALTKRSSRKKKRR